MIPNSNGLIFEGLTLFKFEDRKTHRMPPFFGGDEFTRDLKALANDVVGLNFTQTTDGDRLADHLPQGFELLRSEFTISYNQLREVDFLSGGSYNLVQIGVPVRFSGKRDRLEGTLALVIWENKTQPIIGGREEDGMPKSHVDIQVLHVLQQKYFTNVRYEGNTFLRLEMIGAAHVSGQELEAARGANSLELNQLA
jgi:hypothetical protein